MGLWLWRCVIGLLNMLLLLLVWRLSQHVSGRFIVGVHHSGGRQ